MCTCVRVCLIENALFCCCCGADETERRIFQRLLHNTFVMRKVLEVRSERLYKQANPFALNTIKDWVELLAEHERNRSSTRVEPLSVFADSPATDLAHQGQRLRHPWELKASELAVGQAIGQGAHGAVFEGKYVSPTSMPLFCLSKFLSSSSLVCMPSFALVWWRSVKVPWGGRCHQDFVRYRILVRDGWCRHFCRDSSRGGRNVANASRKHAALFRNLLSATTRRHRDGDRAL